MIRTMQIPEPTKSPSVSYQLYTMSVGARLHAPIYKRKYIASLISGGLKYQYPDRTWTTKIDPKNDQLVIIERTK
jgi:hypothetical protein